MIANTRVSYDGFVGWLMRREVAADSLQAEVVYPTALLQNDRTACAQRLRRARQVLRSQVRREAALP